MYHTGTLRQNLDPEGIAKDEELWESLEQSRLKEHVESMEGGLSAVVSECVPISSRSKGYHLGICEQGWFESLSWTEATHVLSSRPPAASPDPRPR